MAPPSCCFGGGYLTSSSTNDWQADLGESNRGGTADGYPAGLRRANGPDHERVVCGRLDRADRSHAGQQPSRRCGVQVGRRAARDQVSEQGMELVDQPGRLGHGVVAAFVEQTPAPSPDPRRGPGWPPPGMAATHAAAAASMTSFLRRPPRDSWRTRAIAVEGTSSTRSLRATSHGRGMYPLCGSTPITIIPRAPLSVCEWEPRTTRRLEASGSQSILC